MSTRLQMAAQQIGQQGLHEPIRGMYLVHHQQVSQQGRATQMGVARGDAGQQHLVNSANGNLRRQKALGMLGRPALCPLLFGGHVIPLEAEFGQAMPTRIVGADLTRHRQNHGRAILNKKQCVSQPLDAAKHLCRRNARRQGEIQSVHRALLEQMHKTPQRRFGLARPGLSFQNHAMGLGNVRALLNWSRCRNGEEGREIQRTALHGLASTLHGKTHCPHHANGCLS